MDYISEKLEDLNMYPVGLASTRILTDYAQKSPGTLGQSARYI